MARAVSAEHLALTMTVRQQQEQRWGRLRVFLEREDGYAGWAILFIGALFLLLGAFQVALWWNGINVAQAAAQTGYTFARSYQSTAGTGETAALQLINSVGGSLANPAVSINLTAETVTVTVTGNVTSILPGLVLPPTSYTLTGPVERWVPAP